MAAATSNSVSTNPNDATSSFESAPAAMSIFFATQTYFDSLSSSAPSSVDSSSSSAGFSVSSTKTSNTTLSPTSSRTTSHVSTSHTQNPTSTTRPTSAQGKNNSAIAGGVIGGIAIVVLIILLAILYKKRRIRAPPEMIQPFEKPELHSDDYHPHHVELEGTLGKFKYNHNELSELPANEALGMVKEPPLKED